MQAATCSGVPQRCGCRWASACSSRRARSDKALKPTVAELPASECAKAMASSGTGSPGSVAHCCSDRSRRRDHSSASLR